MLESLVKNELFILFYFLALGYISVMASIGCFFVYSKLAKIKPRQLGLSLMIRSMLIIQFVFLILVVLYTPAILFNLVITEKDLAKLAFSISLTVTLFTALYLYSKSKNDT